MVITRVVLAFLFFHCYMCLSMPKPPYLHSFNFELFSVYQYTHYLMELGGMKWLVWSGLVWSDFGMKWLVWSDWYEVTSVWSGWYEVTSVWSDWYEVTSVWNGLVWSDWYEVSLCMKWLGMKWLVWSDNFSLWYEVTLKMKWRWYEVSGTRQKPYLAPNLNKNFVTAVY